MVDAVASQQQLHKILLSWDYFDLWRRCEGGGGVFEELKKVPQTFSSFKVNRELAGGRGPSGAAWTKPGGRGQGARRH